MSVYQQEGRPLSQEAIHQRRLRQGIYTTPTTPTRGVSLNASDAAALLAHTADLTVRPAYERPRAAPEAHTAALVAKAPRAATPEAPELGVGAYHKGTVYRAALALALRVPTFTLELGVGAYLASLMGAVYSAALRNLARLMTLRVLPEKLAARHGLAGGAAAEPVDYARLQAAAEGNTAGLIAQRFNPDVGFRHGVRTDTPQPATHTLSSTFTAGQAAQRRTQLFAAVDVVDLTLLAAALARAHKRLEALAAQDLAELKRQVRLYAQAFDAAQKKLDERMRLHRAGEVDLGGGLKLPIHQVDRLAALVVQPVLEDIDRRAREQRESDLAAATRKAELRAEHERAKAEDAQRRAADKAAREHARVERIAANEARKKDADVAYGDYQTGRHGEVTAKHDEHAALVRQYAEEKAALEQEHAAHTARIGADEEALVQGRKDELAQMQRERDDELAPTLELLRRETEQLQQVTGERDTLKSAVEELEAAHAAHEQRLAELREQLAAAESGIGAVSELLESTAAQRKDAELHVAQLEQEHAAQLELALAAHADLDAGIAELELQRAEHTEAKKHHRGEIEAHIERQIKDERKINRALPEHLQEDVELARFRDVGSLFSKETEPKPEPKRMESVAEAAETKPEAPKPQAAETKSEAPKAEAPKAEAPKSPSGGYKVRLMVTAVETPKNSLGLVPTLLTRKSLRQRLSFRLKKPEDAGNTGVFKEEI